MVTLGVFTSAKVTGDGIFFFNESEKMFYEGKHFSEMLPIPIFVSSFDR